MSTIRSRVAAAIFGALSVLSMPPYGLWPVLVPTLSGLALLLEGTRREASLWQRFRGGAAIGWWFGFGYFLPGLMWIGEAFLVEADRFAWLMPFAVTLMPAGLALFHAAACGVAVLPRLKGPGRLIALAAAIAVAEWLRGHVLTGLPWNLVGYGLTIDPALMQLASLVGVYGLTLWTVLIFSAPAIVVMPEPGEAGPGNGRRNAIWIGLAVALLAAGWGWGSLRLAGGAVGTVPDVRLRLVQPNIAQKEKWAGDNRLKIFNTFLHLTRRDPAGTEDGLGGITHVVWPESSLPFFMLQSSEALQMIAGLLPPGRTLVTGTIRYDEAAAGAGSSGPRPDVFNSLAALDDEGRVVALYDKVHLVPFGEYLPLQSLLESLGLEQLTRLRGGFTAGPGPRRLAVPGLPAAGPLICYEAIFSGDVVGSGERPRWLLNVTNDAWFGTSSGPYQHLHQARLRAVEEGLPLVRVANTGVSAVIDPYGRVLQRLELGSRGVIDTALPDAIAPPPAATAGDAVSIMLLLVAVVVAATLFRARTEGV